MAKKPKPAPQCFSCLAFLSDGKGISLDGGATSHVCMACWHKLPTFRKIQLQMIGRSLEHGGLGIRDVLERFTRAIDQAEDKNGPPLFPGRN